MRLRWVAVIGQTVTLLVVYYGFGFEFPLLACFAVVGIAALLNIVMQWRFPPNKRLQSGYAMLMLGHDVLQLSGLIYLTGGLQNPFSLLMVVPVAVSASTQPIRITAILVVLAALCASFLTVYHMPFPWMPGETLTLPFHYMLGVWTALISCVIFMAIYAWRTARETRQMSDALAATELLLAREQKLSALDGLAAAAAHELGTPLSTISLVAKELEREVPPDSPIYEDILLLRTQAARCRDILGTLTQHSGESDEMYSKMTLGHLIEEVVEPFRLAGTTINVKLEAVLRRDNSSLPEPVLQRNAGMIYALTNLVDNAVDYAASKVDIAARWDGEEIRLSITDDGTGFAPGIIGHLGEPYVTSRPAAANMEGGGMGLGVFIAKTLLERYGATLSLKNCQPPGSGATAEVAWQQPNERQG